MKIRDEMGKALYICKVGGGGECHQRLAVSKERFVDSTLFNSLLIAASVQGGQSNNKAQMVIKFLFESVSRRHLSRVRGSF